MSVKPVIAQVQDEWLRSARSIAGESVRNSLNVFSQLMFVEPGQFILEFLQNAEDARMELGRRGGFFRIELFRDKVVIEHNGKPFDENDVRNLCSIRSSKKPSKGYKGYIGIGWKSVFRVSSHVEIYSRDYAFMFSKSYWYERREELRERYGIESENVPWQVTPILITPTEYVPPDVTRFVVYLDDPAYYEAIAKTVDELRPHIFMFLEYINKVEVIDHVRNLRRVVVWSVEDEEEFEGVKVQRVVVRYQENGSKSFEEFLVFRKSFEVPEDVRKDRVTVSAKREDVMEREVAIAFALDGDSVKPIEDPWFFGVYSFLPLHEVRSGLKFLIQADFIVHPGRRSINYEAKWNRWIMECVAQVVKIAIRYLARRYMTSYLEVFDYRDVDDPFYQQLVKPTVVKVIEQELEDPEVLCIKGHVVKLSKVVKYDPSLEELIKYGLLSEEDLKYIYGEEKHFLDPRVKLRPRDEAKVWRLYLETLLNPWFLKHRYDRDPDSTIMLLTKIYEVAYRNKSYIPEWNRYVITRSGEVKRVSKVYYSEIPESVRDLMNKYSEVREYIERLDFVHEELAERLGREVLEWIGVRKVGFGKVVEETLLPKIRVDREPPPRDELLTITSIIKRANVMPRGPIWVVTIRGEVKRSNEVYYPSQCFEPFDVFNELGLDLLDLNAYMRFDSDETGWYLFFISAHVKATLICTDKFMSSHYEEVVKRVIDLIKSTNDKHKNIRFMRLLKNLYLCAKECWSRIGPVNVLTHDGNLVYAHECLLHDDYDPEEKWFRWREQGFDIGPFVSLEYAMVDGDVQGWREFLVKGLGVREEASKGDIEEFALWLVKRRLEELGYRVKRGGEGFDFRVEAPNGEVYYVEVKGRRRLGEVELTEKETEKAREYRDRYWLVVVFDIPNDPKIKKVRDPIRFIAKVKLGDDIILRHGEDL